MNYEPWTNNQQSSALSSSGLGRVVLSHQTGVRLPVALPKITGACQVSWQALFLYVLSYAQVKSTELRRTIWVFVHWIISGEN